MNRLIVAAIVAWRVHRRSIHTGIFRTGHAVRGGHLAVVNNIRRNRILANLRHAVAQVILRRGTAQAGGLADQVLVNLVFASR
ncbi:MAG: hypothetical protein JRF33_23450 [Deltaproteobacteria bacterium]|nr:hypothetical protein [Deltaproteobacteria bacterium]